MEEKKEVELKTTYIYSYDELSLGGSPTFYLMRGVLCDDVMAKRGRLDTRNIRVSKLHYMSDVDLAKENKTIRIRGVLQGKGKQRQNDWYTDAAWAAIEEHIREESEGSSALSIVTDLCMERYDKPQSPFYVMLHRNEHGGLYTRINTNPNYSGLNAHGKVHFTDKQWTDAMEGAAKVSVRVDTPKCGFVIGKMLSMTVPSMQELADYLYEKCEDDSAWSGRIIHGVQMGDDIVPITRWFDNAMCSGSQHDIPADWLRFVKVIDEEAGHSYVDYCPCEVEHDYVVKHTVWRLNVQAVIVGNLLGSKDAVLEVSRNFYQSEFGYIVSNINRRLQGTWSHTYQETGDKLVDWGIKEGILSLYQLNENDVSCLLLDMGKLYRLGGLTKEAVAQFVEHANRYNRGNDEKVKKLLKSGKLRLDIS